MTGEVSIRECRTYDVPDVLSLWVEADAVVSKTDTAADVRRALETPAALFLVAEIEGRIIGTVIGSFDGWRGNIYRMAVHPDYRRQGVARSLLEGLEGFFDIQGVKRVTALVESEHPWAVGFWEAAGYQFHKGIAMRCGFLTTTTPIGCRRQAAVRRNFSAPCRLLLTWT